VTTEQTDNILNAAGPATFVTVCAYLATDDAETFFAMAAGVLAVGLFAFILKSFDDPDLRPRG
jgi:hypothetical protein